MSSLSPFSISGDVTTLVENVSPVPARSVLDRLVQKLFVVFATVKVEMFRPQEAKEF